MTWLTDRETEIRDRCQIQTADTIITTTVINAFINRALRWIDGRKPGGWPWQRTAVSFSTVADTKSYAFTTVGTNVRQIRSLAVLIGTEYEILDRYPAADAARQFPSTVTMRPYAWSVEGSTVYLWPTPDAVYTIRAEVVLHEDTSITGSEVPRLPAYYYDAVVERAAYHVFLRLHNGDEAASANAAALEWVSLMTADRQYTGGGRVSVTSDPLI